MTSSGTRPSPTDWPNPGPPPLTGPVVDLGQSVGPHGYGGRVLTTVAVEGYRSLRHVVLPLRRLSVVTGPNGSGKSSLYRSLRLLADCARGGAIAGLARQGGFRLDAMGRARADRPGGPGRRGARGGDRAHWSGLAARGFRE